MSTIFIIFLIFQNIFLRYLPANSVINYWDEAITIILMFSAVIVVLSRKKPRTKFDILILILIIGGVIAGFVSNSLFHLQANNGAAFRDMVSFVKLPAAFICARITGLDTYLTKRVGKRSIKFFRAIVLIMFVCALISLVIDIGMSQPEIRYGFRPFQFLFSHPTQLVFSCTLLLGIFDATDYRINILAYEVMLLVIIALSMRTKGFALIVVYFTLKYGNGFVKKHRILLVGISMVGVWLVSVNTLKMYASFSNSPRESLYKGAIELAKMYFPIGSGFGTFGSMISGTTGSAVYGLIGVSGAWVNGQLTTVLGDAGYAYYLGQFGVLGLLFFAGIVFSMFRIAAKPMQKLPGMILLIYLIIALTAESTGLNFGLQFGIILGMIIRMEEMNEYSETNRNRIII